MNSLLSKSRWVILFSAQHTADAALWLSQLLSKPVHCTLEPVLQRHSGGPSKFFACESDVWPTSCGVLLGSRGVYDFGRRPGCVEHSLSELGDRDLFWVANVHWADKTTLINHCYQSSNQVIDVAETSCLHAVSVYR